MTRRSFLKNLAGALAVLAIPVAVKTAAEQRMRGVRLEVDPYPLRFNWDGTEFVRVDMPRHSLRPFRFPRIFINTDGWKHGC